MARPAPKKRGATSASRRRSTSRRWSPPGWLWGIAGLVAGFLLAQHQHGTAPWQTGQDSPLANLLPRPAPSEESASPSSAAPAADDEPRMPTFEFYTLLPETEVIAPRSEMPASTARPPAPSSEADEESETTAVDDPIARVIAANLQPVEPSEPSVAAARVSDGNRYMLQAASFREEGDAQQLSQRLRNLSLIA
jgi:cell division protein FtsN